MTSLDRDTTNHDPATETLARWAELTAAATPGPWRRGDVWQWAVVMPDLFGPDKCAFCHNGKLGPPVWSGDADINGELQPAHKHYDPDPYGADRLVSGPDGLVAGSVSDDEGGIIDPADTAFVAEARAAMPELLAFARDVLKLRSDRVDPPPRPGSSDWISECGFHDCLIDIHRLANRHLGGEHD